MATRKHTVVDRGREAAEAEARRIATSPPDHEPSEGVAPAIRTSGASYRVRKGDRIKVGTRGTRYGDYHGQKYIQPGTATPVFADDTVRLSEEAALAVHESNPGALIPKDEAGRRVLRRGKVHVPGYGLLSNSDAKKADVILPPGISRTTKSGKRVHQADTIRE